MRLRRRTPSAWDAASPDDELVAWAQRGEREAFGLLYDRHFPSVYGYCYRCLGEREAAQDAAAETFRKALVALPVYRPQAFRGWLFAIARNVIADARRRHLEVPLDDALMAPSLPDSLEDTALVRADVAALVALLPQLTPDQHDAIALRLAGLTSAEIDFMYIQSGEIAWSVENGEAQITRAARDGQPGTTETLAPGPDATLHVGETVVFDYTQGLQHQGRVVGEAPTVMLVAHIHNPSKQT